MTHRKAIVRIAVLVLLLCPVSARPGWAGAVPVDGLADVVAKLLPSVVNINTVRVEEGTGDPPAGMTKAATTRRKSLGSGFIIDASGIIVTNKHVIDGAADIAVTLNDGTVLSAQVLSDAGRGDLAILRVTPDHPLVPVTFGDSDLMRQGDLVIAVGNPLGFSSSVTTGVVSALDRDVKTSPYDNYIQTDAAINTGNSGGPLFNIRGEVIGVNTALITAADGGGSIGIGLSIPSNDAKFVVRRLMQYGRVRPGWVGIRVQQMTQGMAEALGLKRALGVIVNGFEPGQTGLRDVIQIGDVIEQVQDSPVNDVRMFLRAVGAQPVGSITPVVLWREGKRSVVKLQVDEDPEDLKNKSGTPMEAMDDGYVEAPNLGLSLGTIDDAARAIYQLPASTSGVVVTSVVPNSHAADQGVLPGDIILRVQETPVDTPDAVWREVEALRTARRTKLLILLRNADGMDRFVVMPSA